MKKSELTSFLKENLPYAFPALVFLNYGAEICYVVDFNRKNKKMHRASRKHYFFISMTQSYKENVQNKHLKHTDRREGTHKLVQYSLVSI